MVKNLSVGFIKYKHENSIPLQFKRQVTSLKGRIQSTKYEMFHSLYPHTALRIQQALDRNMQEFKVKPKKSITFSQCDIMQ